MSGERRGNGTRVAPMLATSPGSNVGKFSEGLPDLSTVVTSNLPATTVFQYAIAGRYWNTLARCTSPKEAKERLKYIWGTLALISALFAALTMPTATAPPTPDDDGDLRVHAYIILFFTALILSFVVIMTTMGMLATLDYCPTDVDIAAYIQEFAWYGEVIYVVFIASFLAMIAGILSYAHFKYPPRVFWTILAIYVGLAVLNSFFVFRVDIWSKARVARYQVLLDAQGRGGAADGGAPGGDYVPAGGAEK